MLSALHWMQSKEHVADLRIVAQSSDQRSAQANLGIVLIHTLLITFISKFIKRMRLEKVL